MDHFQYSGRVALAIGEKVRRRRIEGGLSEQAVARALGCDVEHFRSAEAGLVNFTPENIVDLCSILRVVPSWFFDGICEV